MAQGFWIPDISVLIEIFEVIDVGTLERRENKLPRAMYNLIY